MNISKTDIGVLNSVLNVKIEKADYSEKVEKSVREIKRKVNLKGFRQGMVPTGLVKKMYGKNVLIEEVNKILSESLLSYIKDNKINILYEPLILENNLEKIDLNDDPTFEFAFEIGISPEINIVFDKNEKIPFYNISIDNESIENYKAYYLHYYGSYITAEQSDEKSILEGRIAQINDDGRETENGLSKENVKLYVSIVEDEEFKSQLIGIKVGDTVKFDIKKVFHNDDKIAELLNIKKQNLNLTSTNFIYIVSAITKYKESEINQEFWDKIYGKDEVTSEEQFLEKIKSEIFANNKVKSEFKLKTDIRNKLMEKATFELPNTFLKKWIKKNSKKELTDEIFNKEYAAYQQDMKWQLIKEKYINENQFKVTDNEIKEMAVKFALEQYRQYGAISVSEKLLEDMTNSILKNEKERIEKIIIEDKVLDFVKNLINLEIKEVSIDEFQKLK